MRSSIRSAANNPVSGREQQDFYDLYDASRPNSRRGMRPSSSGPQEGNLSPLDATAEQRESGRDPGGDQPSESGTMGGTRKLIV